MKHANTFAIFYGMSSQKSQTEWTASLSDLLRGYARVKTRDEYRPLNVDRSAIFSMDQALERLKKLMGVAMEWGQLASFLPEGWALEPARLYKVVTNNYLATGGSGDHQFL